MKRTRYKTLIGTTVDMLCIAILLLNMIEDWQYLMTQTAGIAGILFISMRVMRIFPAIFATKRLTKQTFTTIKRIQMNEKSNTKTNKNRNILNYNKSAIATMFSALGMGGAVAWYADNIFLIGGVAAGAVFAAVVSVINLKSKRVGQAILDMKKRIKQEKIQHKLDCQIEKQAMKELAIEQYEAKRLELLAREQALKEIEMKTLQAKKAEILARQNMQQQNATSVQIQSLPSSPAQNSAQTNAQQPWL